MVVFDDTEPGRSAADLAAVRASFAMTKEGEPLCSYVGLTRGMIVDVSCPESQVEAGKQLFRTVVQRIKDI